MSRKYAVFCPFALTIGDLAHILTEIHITWKVRVLFMTEKTEWMSVEQVAQDLGVHPDTIRLYIREGTLPAVQLKRSYRINRKDLEDFLKRRYVNQDKKEPGE